MGLYAIGDLHFSTENPKPMNIFGDNWDNHEKKIVDNWSETVKDDDTVLVLGDTSWAMNLNEAKSDLDIIESLPGKKIFIKGNHDYWWSSLSKINAVYESDDMNFIQNGYFTYGDYAICGSRGWLCPNEVKFDSNDMKIYRREVLRLEMSIQSAIQNGCNNIIVITHYPPTNDQLEESEFTKLYEKYNVTKVIYGHPRRQRPRAKKSSFLFLYPTISLYIKVQMCYYNVYQRGGRHCGRQNGGFLLWVF